MADIKQIKLGTETYDIVDDAARTDIETLKNTVAKAMHFLGTTTSTISDGATTNPITIGSESVTAVDGDVVVKGNKEYVWGSAAWHELGDATGLDNLGDFAFADEGTFTTSAFVTGVGNPTINHTPTEISTTYTPSVSVSKPEITVTLNSDTIQPVTNVGSAATYTLPTLTTTVTNGVLEIAFDKGTFDGGSAPTLGTAKTFATSVKSATSGDLTVTPTEATIKMSYDKATSATQGTVTKASTTVTVSPKE